MVGQGKNGTKSDTWRWRWIRYSVTTAVKGQGSILSAELLEEGGRKVGEHEKRTRWDPPQDVAESSLNEIVLDHSPSLFYTS